jgi:hypothetical protein
MIRYEVLKNRKDLIIALLLFLFLGLILLPYYQYIINSDGISYISIAREYLNGQFLYAVNGYWGPLFSWLLIPFLIIWHGNVQALYSAKVLSLFIVLFTIIGVYSLSFKLGFDEKLRAAVLLVFIPITLFLPLIS